MYAWLCMYSMVMAYDIAIYAIELIAKHKAWMCCLYVAKLYVLSCKKRMNVSFIICNVECIAIHNTYENDICHYACVHVRLFFVSVYVCLSVWVYVCIYVCLYLCLSMCMTIYGYIYSSRNLQIHTCMSIHPSICMHANTWSMHVWLCVCVCMYAHLPICLCACILCMHVI